MADLRGTSNFCARYSIVGMLFMVGYIILYYVTLYHIILYDDYAAHTDVGCCRTIKINY